MATYMTKQRKELVHYLSEHPHELFSVTQIVEHFQNGEISTSSIYRNLNELAVQGIICKVIKTGTRESYYRYVKADFCENQMHLFCTICEQTVHVQDDTACYVNGVIREREGFHINQERTVIYGTCEECRK